jgi:hypothetical protein
MPRPTRAASDRLGGPILRRWAHVDSRRGPVSGLSVGAGRPHVNSASMSDSFHPTARLELLIRAITSRSHGATGQRTLRLYGTGGANQSPVVRFGQ